MNPQAFIEEDAGSMFDSFTNSFALKARPSNIRSIPPSSSWGGYIWKRLKLFLLTATWYPLVHPDLVPSLPQQAT